MNPYSGVYTIRGSIRLKDLHSLEEENISPSDLLEQTRQEVARVLVNFTPKKKEKKMSAVNAKDYVQNLYWVAILKDPTQKEVEEKGKGTTVLMPPRCVAASNQQSAAVKAAREFTTPEGEPDINFDSPLVRIQVVPFEDQKIE